MVASSFGKPGPFQIVEQEYGSDTCPTSAPKRNYGCANYETCLNLAAALNWDNFTCRGCSGEIDGTLLWRARQAVHQDKELREIIPTLEQTPAPAAMSPSDSNSLSGSIAHVNSRGEAPSKGASKGQVIAFSSVRSGCSDTPHPVTVKVMANAGDTAQQTVTVSRFPSSTKGQGLEDAEYDAIYGGYLELMRGSEKIK